MRRVTIPRRELQTQRLILRPSDLADASRAWEIRSDWEITRMLRLASFPPDQGELRTWFGCHEREWLDGRAYRYAVQLDGRMIGLVDIDGIDQEDGHLGYWLERSAWGRGYGLEAARAVVHFAFQVVRLSRLRAAHALDNPASGRVLTKLGFTYIDTVERASRSRGGCVSQCRYVLTSAPQ